MPFAPGKRYQEIAARRARAAKQRTQAVFLPPSQGGINAIDGAANVPPNDALRLINMVPQEYGTAVRKGYREHCPPVPLGDGIKTVMPFVSKTTDTDTSRLFCATSDGIYEITTPGAAPIKRFDFPVKTALAGWCSWHNFQTLAGQFLLICDLANGYIVYDGTANTFAVGVITGPTPAEVTLDFVTVWKNRVWLVQQDTGTAWYLPVGTFTGLAKEFNFGNKFKYGGHLKGLWNWTLDGGEGVDDYLVGISAGGDCVVYKGTDPDTAGDFNMQGSFFLGTPPRGRRIADDFGGDLLVLTSAGCLQLSKLIGGLPVTDEQVSISRKINPRLNQFMDRTLDLFGWEIRSFPREQLIILAAPQEVGRPPMQFVYQTATRAWSQFNNLPMLTGEVFKGKFYIGTLDNRVFTYEGYVDNVLLADAGASANAIEWEGFTSFQSYGAPATFKRIQMMRPQFVGTEVPAFFIQANYDFDISAITGSPGYVVPAGGLWNTGLWDGAAWGGGFIVDQPPWGGSGVGRHIAINMRGRSSNETIHVGTDVMFDTGGLL
jgi:hypothetical protein